MMCHILAEREDFILLTLKIDYGYDTPKIKPGDITYDVLYGHLTCKLVVSSHKEG